ncbi:hypothetical protein ACVMGC_001874 [Bradyrhizobium barranii subsp. barranii]
MIRFQTTIEKQEFNTNKTSASRSISSCLIVSFRRLITYRV